MTPKELEGHFKVVPLVIPLPMLEAIVREFEHGDLPPELKNEINLMLHYIYEYAKTTAVYPSQVQLPEITDAPRMDGIPAVSDVDFEELVEFVARRTRQPAEIVREILEAEDDYFAEKFG